ncbi:MAG: hypothetical protein NTW19_03330 [Planctomycetota bacterium]|nr:hypothetical protein [Planctomycetota bacterium]
MFEQLLNWFGDKVFLLRQRHYGRSMARGHHLRASRLPDFGKLADAVRPAALLAFAKGNAQGIAALGLVALIATGGLRAVGSVFAQPEPVARAGKAHNVYYFDLGTGGLYAAPSNSPMPMPAPSGKLGPNGTLGGVRAYVFACGNCAEPAARFTGYIETIDPASLVPPPAEGEAPAAPPGHTALMAAFGRVIAVPDIEPRWISPTSEEGLVILHQLHKQCGEQPLKTCAP